MKLWGITGGIGMGKSTTASFLQALGKPVVDTDELARDLVQPGQPALQEIRARFGERVFSAEGTLNRSLLASIVFQDAGALKDLEAILHPRIRTGWMDLSRQWEEKGEASGFVVIPLLFETQAEAHFDQIICVACSAASQQIRLRERGWTTQQINQRLQAQWSVEHKINHADVVVWTEGNLGAHREQLLLVLKERG